MALSKPRKFTLKQRWLFTLIVINSLWAAALFYLQGTPDFTANNLQQNVLWYVWTLTLLLSIWQFKGLLALDREIQAINLHATSLRDNAFNLSANKDVLAEFLPLAETLISMSDHLQRERANLYQREMLLDTVLQTSPSALVLADEQDRVILCNPAARQLLNNGKNFQGSLLHSLLDQNPEIRTAIERQESLVFFDSTASILHLSTSQFQLNHHRHYLYQLKPITREIHQEEIKSWKKLLRVISHELNNSLAPMSSLAYSGRLQAEQAGLQNIATIFSSISERCQHLNQFLQEYLALAKLPAPTRKRVNWSQLINELQDHYEFELIDDLPQHDWLLDQSQLAQLLLNCLKNSQEAGASPNGIHLSFTEQTDALLIELQDDGGGMSEECLAHALVPFYTTKEKGSGIGLTLCQDIVQGHDGKFELLNRPPGLLIRIWLPK